MLADDALAAQLVDATGGQLEPMNLLSMIQGDELDATLKDKISTAILGGAGDAKLVIKPGSAAFDYATESAAAAAAQSPELKRLLKK